LQIIERKGLEVVATEFKDTWDQPMYQTTRHMKKAVAAKVAAMMDRLIEGGNVDLKNMVLAKGEPVARQEVLMQKGEAVVREALQAELGNHYMCPCRYSKKSPTVIRKDLPTM